MSDDGNEEKRGYKHPPKEHRFKPGQKPPPRKKKAPKDSISVVQLFWHVLQEPRKATVNGKKGWFRASDLIVRKAFALAEQGNSTLNRLLNQLLLENLSPDEDLQTSVYEPDHAETEITTYYYPDTLEYVDGKFMKKR